MTELISTMNDSKWCRLLQALDDLRLPVSYWKFLKDDREFQMPMPGSDDIVEHQGNRGIGDYGVSGPFFFKEVQQVRWPRTWQRNWAPGYEPVTEHQPIEALSAALDACGKFDYMVDENDLILFAYRKVSSGE